MLLRRILPNRLAVFLKRCYRKARVRLVSGFYGNPAKQLKVIAITGTNGKTTTANYINEVFKAARFKTAMFSTAVIEQAGQRHINDLNMSVASTTTMQRFFRDAVRGKVDYVILEATSHSLYQHKLDGVPIDTAVMTNLTQDHLDYHSRGSQTILYLIVMMNGSSISPNTPLRADS